MLRVARAFKLTSRLEEELDLIGRAPLKIAKLSIATLFMSHIFACGWAGMARINGEGSYYTNSWVSMWGAVDSGFTKEYLSALYVYVSSVKCCISRTLTFLENNRSHH